MGPELALAIDACVTGTTSLLMNILKTANEVRHHKEKCLALGKEARSLQRLLEEHKSNIRTLETVKQFKALFHDIDSFVVLSKTWTIVGATIDTLFTHGFRKLMDRSKKIKQTLTLEAIVSIRFIQFRPSVGLLLYRPLYIG
jgi:hypothetical protein